MVVKDGDEQLGVGIEPVLAEDVFKRGEGLAAEQNVAEGEEIRGSRTVWSGGCRRRRCCGAAGEEGVDDRVAVVDFADGVEMRVERLK